MFGYIVPRECELKVREQAAYKCAYCGLCKSIQRHYGPLSAGCLQYDCTFLALLLGSLAGEKGESRLCRCLHRWPDPRRRYRLESPSLHFSAAVNVLLAYYKCLDGQKDEHALKDRAGALLLAGAHKKAAAEFPQVEEAARLYMQAQARAEEAHAGPDEAAHPTGVFLRRLAALAPGVPQEAQRPLDWLLYHLGRWIYFMDAWDDLEKDRQSGAFNPFLTESRETAAFCIHSAMSQCRQAASLLPLTRDRGLIENILELGCPHRAVALLGQTPEEDKKLEERDEPL